MTIFANWPHRWFGVWGTASAELASFPNKQDFVDPEWECPQRQDLVHYLRQSPLLMMSHGGAWRTDGVWLWWDEVAEEMERGHLRLPDPLVAHIAGRGFEPMPYLETSIQRLHDTLDWPGGRPLAIILKIIETDEQRAGTVREFHPAWRNSKPAPGRPPANLIEWLMDRVGVSMRG